MVSVGWGRLRYAVVRIMKLGYGKAKGGEFERYICKTLSLWISAGEKTDLFWRSAMSGGRASVAKKMGVSIRQVGDICAVAPEGHQLCDHFFIECKHTSDLNVEGWLIKDIGPLAKYWKKAKTQCDRLAPLLIAKQNLHEALLISDHELQITAVRPLLVRADGTHVYNFDVVMSLPFISPKTFLHGAVRANLPRVRAIRGRHGTSQIHPE